MPVKNLTALAAFRYTHEEKTAPPLFLDTNTTANTAPFSPSNPQGGFHRIPNSTPNAAIPPMSSTTSGDFRAALHRRRALGLYARGDWTEEWGNVKE
jgi:hypothetical protein